MSRRPNPAAMRLALLAALSLAVLAIAPFVGAQRVLPGDLWGTGADAAALQTFLALRLPRVLMGFVAGAALAVSGMAFQAMFRNPLATPYTLGVSSGAAFGATLALLGGLPLAFAGAAGTAFCAMAGALAAILLVYGLTRARRGFSTATMLLAGVAVSMLFSSLIMLLQFFSDFTRSFQVLRWLMGGIEEPGYAEVGIAAVFTVAGLAVVAALTHELNLLATGDDIAAGRGVAVRRVKKVLFLATSLMVAGVVAVCGPIGFVGMIVPQMCRLWIGPNHRALLPASALSGGAFLVVCDAAARVAARPAELPVGVITSLLGGPFFLWLLLTNGRARRGFVED